MPVIDVADFFCGCGGTSAGLRKAGMNIVIGIDNDPDLGFHLFKEFSRSTLRLARCQATTALRSRALLSKRKTSPVTVLSLRSPANHLPDNVHD